MNVMIIKTSTSYAAVAAIRSLASNPGISFHRARLNVKQQPTPSSNSEDWPLILECQSTDVDLREFEVRIHMLTCGYGGEGPHDLAEILRITGFKGLYDEEKLYTCKSIKQVITK